MAASPLEMCFSPAVISANGMSVLPMPRISSGVSPRRLKGRRLPCYKQQQIQPNGGDAGADEHDLKRAKLLHADANKQERGSPHQTQYPEASPFTHVHAPHIKRATPMSRVALHKSL
jgi:hypothetical protein